jgi:hypothetical protein
MRWLARFRYASIERARRSKSARWIARFYFAQHNARVLEDMEYRFGVVLCEATQGRMSKAYYDLRAMLQEISEVFAEHGSEAYADGHRDALEEHGILTGEPA